MVNDYNAVSYIINFFSNTFVKQGETNPMPLSDIELSYLEQLLWFTANVVADTDKSRVDALNSNLDKYLGVVVHNYKSQFTANIWKVMTWCISVLAMALNLLTKPDPEVFNCFICLHMNEAIDVVVNKTTQNDKENDETSKQQLKFDLMQIIWNLSKDFDDE